MGSSLFARHYLGNVFRKAEKFFLFLRVLRCFNSPSCFCAPMNSVRNDPIFHRIRFPHSEIPGSKVACHLTEAYRRLLRPSSAIQVKASTICTYLFNHKNYENIIPVAFLIQILLFGFCFLNFIVYALYFFR